MNDHMLKYYSNNSSQVYANNSRDLDSSGYAYNSPIVQFKGRGIKDNGSLERPRSNAGKAFGIELPQPLRIIEQMMNVRPKNIIENGANSQDKKNSFQMTFFNMNRVRDKEPLKPADISRARETPKHSSVGTRKQPEKLNDKMIFYQQIQRPRRPDESKPPSEHSTSRNPPRVTTKDIHNESLEKTPQKIGAYTQKQLSDMLQETSYKLNNSAMQTPMPSDRNLPYLVQKSSHSKNPHRTGSNFLSNNSSFYHDDRDESRRAKVSINNEEGPYSHKPSVSYSRDVSSSQRHRRGLSMGHNDKSSDLGNAYPNSEISVDKKRSQNDTRNAGSSLNVSRENQNSAQNNNYVIPVMPIQNLPSQQGNNNIQPPKVQPHPTLEKDQPPPREQHPEDDYYAQFFRTNKLTFDFEKIIISHRNKSPNQIFTPLMSPVSGPKHRHHRHSSVGDDSRSNKHMQRENSDLIQLIQLNTEHQYDTRDLASQLLDNTLFAKVQVQSYLMKAYHKVLQYFDFILYYAFMFQTILHSKKNQTLCSNSLWRSICSMN